MEPLKQCGLLSGVATRAAFLCFQVTEGKSWRHRCFESQGVGSAGRRSQSYATLFLVILDKSRYLVLSLAQQIEILG